MTSVEEDTDRSLMDEIQALFAPPGREKNRESKIVELHPYYKRPGKGHNHDSCDGCGEGGDLICCDSCPASFHLSCHAPPLEDSDIPKGDWVCLECHYKEVKRNGTIDALAALDNISSSSSVDSFKRPEGLETSEMNGNSSFGTRSSRNKHAKALKQKIYDDKCVKKDKAIKIYRNKYNAYLAVKPLTNSPFDALIAASQVTNAAEFSLPRELESNERLPFSWKWNEDQEESSFKTCQNCHKTKRGIPALACDYCASVYHLDCLNPPLCEIPKGRWMCPTHVEHYIDEHLVQSTSLSKRIKLWNKYARSPVDTDAVRIEFFRKVHSGKRGCDRLYRKKKIPLTHRVQVPQYIKNQYRHPLPQLSPIDIRHRDISSDEWISNLISLQTSCLRHQTEEQRVVLSKKTKGKEQMSDSEETISNCSLNLVEEENGDKSEEEDNDDVVFDEDTRAILNEYIGKNYKRGLNSLSPLVKEFLALQKIKELFPKERKNSESSQHEVRARANLVPLHISKIPTPIRYRSFNIGLGSGYELDLSTYGHCNYVSRKTACIFYDQYSQIYEIINYSEHGCIVDNTVYGLDLNESRYKDSHRKSDSKIMSARTHSKSCHCSSSIGSLFRQQTQDKSHKYSNCESSAILHHGSYIRFGCLQFVFSILDSEIDSNSNAQQKIPI